MVSVGTVFFHQQLRTKTYIFAIKKAISIVEVAFFLPPQYFSKISPNFGF
jgi:hypothetical protein